MVKDGSEKYFFRFAPTDVVGYFAFEVYRGSG